MKPLISVFLLVLSLQALGQTDFNSASNIVTQNDLKRNTYSKDSTANAIVLYEKGTSYFNTKNVDLSTLHTEVQKKVKILNSAGFKNANISILLYKNKGKKEKIKDIIGVTHNLVDGMIKKTYVKPTDIYEEQYDENHTLVKFTFPDIKAGSVITYQYKLSSPFIFKYHPWEFQGDIPKLYSEYNTSIPGTYIYNIKLVGTLDLYDKKETLDKGCIILGQDGVGTGCVNTTYIMKAIPAFVEEDYMTTKENYLSRIDYEMNTSRDFKGNVNKYSKTWKDVDKELRATPEFGGQLTKSISLKSIMNTDVETELDPLKKAKMIYEYIQSNYNWNTKYHLFKNVSINNLMKNKSGNSAEINILLHNALKKAKIDVKPVILSTRNNGFATKVYPVITDFNYVIVRAIINDETYFLDATEKDLPFGVIPFRCLNQYGRLIDFKNSSKWIDITAKKTSYIKHSANYSLDSDATLHVDIKSRYSGYPSFSKKRAYFSNPETYLTNFENNHTALKVNQHTVQSETVTNTNFDETFELEVNDINTVGDTYYIDPFVFKFFKTNPFQLQNRTYPIDFGYKDTFSYLFKMDFAENFKLVDMPKSISAKLPDNKGSFTMVSRSAGNTLALSLTIKFSEAIYPPEYYETLKLFMNQIVNAQTKTLIVLKKTP